MEEVREITSGETMYSVRIFSDQLLSLAMQCPDDGAGMKAIGDMYLNKNSPKWRVEYVCKKDGEIFRIASHFTGN